MESATDQDDLDQQEQGATSPSGSSDDEEVCVPTLDESCQELCLQAGDNPLFCKQACTSSCTDSEDTGQQSSTGQAATGAILSGQVATGASDEIAPQVCERETDRRCFAQCIRGGDNVVACKASCQVEVCEELDAGDTDDIDIDIDIDEDDEDEDEDEEDEPVARLNQIALCSQPTMQACLAVCLEKGNEQSCHARCGVCFAERTVWDIVTAERNEGYRPRFETARSIFGQRL